MTGNVKLKYYVVYNYSLTGDPVYFRLMG